MENKMRAHRLILALAFCAAGAAGGPTGLPPLPVQDLGRLARVSDPAVSPDGKRVAYALRTTDLDANKGRTAIWLLDVHKRNATAARLTDLAANSSAPEWSGDGHLLYYLSNRSGSSQVWQLAAGNEIGEPAQ